MHSLCCGQVDMVGGSRTAWWPVRCRIYKALAVSETQDCAEHYKVNSTKSLKHYTPALAEGSIAHHPYTDTVSTHQRYMHIGLCLEAGPQR